MMSMILCTTLKKISHVTSLSFFVDFKSLFNARFPSSLQTCQLRFQVQKLSVNFATKIASTFQCLNYCKQMLIVQVEFNNSMEISWSSGPTKKVCISLNWSLLLSVRICLQTKFKH